MVIMMLLTSVLLAGNVAAEAKETEMNIWIQHADTSTIDVKANSAEEAVRAFNNFDWKKEQEKQRQKHDDGVVRQKKR